MVTSPGAGPARPGGAHRLSSPSVRAAPRPRQRSAAGQAAPSGAGMPGGRPAPAQPALGALSGGGGAAARPRRLRAPWAAGWRGAPAGAVRRGRVRLGAPARVRAPAGRGAAALGSCAGRRRGRSGARSRSRRSAGAGARSRRRGARPGRLPPFPGRGARRPSAPCLRMENAERSVLDDPLHTHRPPLPERSPRPRCAHPLRPAARCEPPLRAAPRATAAPSPQEPPPPGCGFPTSSGKGCGAKPSDGAPTAAGGAEAPAHPTPPHPTPSHPSRLPGPQLLPPPAARAGAARPQSFCSRCCASILCPRRRISSSRKLGRFSFSLCSLSVYGTRRERANVSGKALGILRGVSLKPGVFSLFPGVLAVSSCYSYSSFIKELHLFFFPFLFFGEGR